MAKHIHIHLPTTDAGFDESKVKRDEGGKFAQQASHHAARSAEHTAAWKRHGTAAEISGAHMVAEGLHNEASRHYSEAARHHAAGNKDHADMHAKLGAHWASEAAKIEKNGFNGSPPTHPEKPAAPQLSDRQAMLREMGSPRYSGRTPPNPDDELVSVPMAGSGKEKTFAIPKPPAGTPGGPVKGRGPVDLGNKENADRQAKPAVSPEQKKVPLSVAGIRKLQDRWDDAFESKATSWASPKSDDAVPATEVAHYPEFTSQQVYGGPGATVPAGTDFAPSFSKLGHAGFIIRHPNGDRHVVHTEGYDYARYHAPINEKE